MHKLVSSGQATHRRVERVAHRAEHPRRAQRCRGHDRGVRGGRRAVHRSAHGVTGRCDRRLLFCF